MRADGPRGMKDAFSFMPTAPQRGKISTQVKRCYSLKRNKEFRYVYRRGNSKANELMVVIFTKNRTPALKHIGFSVSKKLGNSVCRNRVKRRLRSAFDTVFGEIKPGYNMIVIARAPILGADFSDICAAARSLLRRGDLLKKEENKE